MIAVAASAVTPDSELYVAAVLVLSNLFAFVTVTYTVPLGIPSCAIVTVALVALVATVAVPAAVPPVDAVYTFTTSPATRPVTATVSLVPT